MTDFAYTEFKALFSDRPKHREAEEALKKRLNQLHRELYDLDKDDVGTSEDLRKTIETLEKQIAGQEEKISELREKRNGLYAALHMGDTSLIDAIMQKEAELEAICASPIYKGEYPYVGTPLGDEIAQWESGVLLTLEIAFSHIPKAKFDALREYAEQTTHGDLDEDGDEKKDTTFTNAMKRLFSLLKLFERMQNL